ncbi:hypothetical protein NOK12_39520 [Nocardioides sp. OK12]|nr:hypothetical protein NOK12_39520 [Nocardioides sp. OK12]
MAVRIPIRLVAPRLMRPRELRSEAKRGLRLAPIITVYLLTPVIALVLARQRPRRPQLPLRQLIKSF